MANITLNIPDNLVGRIVNGLCAAVNLPPTNANAKLALISLIKQTLVQVEQIQAKKVIPDVDSSDLGIT